jgi:SAM-dependent methyltransferase
MSDVEPGAHFATVRATYDTVAGDYAERFGGELDAKPFDRALLAAFAELVGDAGPVADVGCGPGHIGAHLRGLGLDVRGVDLSPGMIDAAREHHPGIRFDVGDMLDLDIPDGELAGVVAFYSIIHIPTGQLPRVFAEFRRVLSPGGRLILAFQLGDGSGTVRRGDFLGHEVELRAWFRQPADVAALLAAAGLPVHATLSREPDENEGTQRAYLFARKATAG